MTDPSATITAAATPRAGQVRSLAALVAAQVAALSTWFSAAAVTPALALDHGLAPADLAGLTSATQGGFVVGALILAATGLADRVDPRRLFAACALGAALANLTLLISPPDGLLAAASRALVGAALAGVYPVGLKIAVGWSVAKRGLVTSLLVGALTLGSATPHAAVLAGGADWRVSLLITSAACAMAAGLILTAGLGPHHRAAGRLDPGAIVEAWRNSGVRRAYLGYFGHMWELYAFWAWVGVAMASAAAGRVEDPTRFGAGVAFAAIGVGALACVVAGTVADRVGKAAVARTAMIVSGLAALTSALVFSGPVWALAAALIVWGAAVIPDSPQFSAMVADASPPERAGSLMTLQTALGFALTVIAVQGAPHWAEIGGWPMAFSVLAVGPFLGVLAMGRAPRSASRPG